MSKLSDFFQQLSLKPTPPPQPDLNSATSEAVTLSTSTNKTPYLTPANIKLLLISATILIVGGTSWMVWQKGWLTKVKPIPASAQVTLKADDQASDGVSPTTTFTLQSDEELSPASVKANFKSEPAVDFKVSRVTPTTLTLTPAQPLDQETVYKFALVTDAESDETLATWAFQTQGEFRITQTMPRDKATSVATNTSIELTFSHEKFADPAKFVSFDPPLEGKWERHYQTAVFLPKNLDQTKIYTVKVDHQLGLEGTNKTLTTDKIFKFETSQSDGENFWLSTDRELLEFGAEEIPAVTVSFSQTSYSPAPVNELQVKVFAYNSSEDFAKAWSAKQSLPSWSQAARDLYQVPTNNLREIATFNAELQKSDSYKTYFNFPEALPNGWYLTQISLTKNEQTKTVYSWLQVSDLAAYVNLSQTDSMVWVMDRSNSQPVQAKIKLWGKSDLGETNDAGVAIFKTPGELLTNQKLTPFTNEEEEKQPQLMLVQAGNKSVFLPSFTNQPRGYAMHWGWYDMQASPTNQYWQYLNFDKPMYKPGDTVRFWGMLRDRDNKKLPTEELMAKVMTGYGEERTLLAKGPTIKLAEDGTFIGEVTLPQVKPGSYYIELYKDSATYFYQFIDVQAYVKPAYTLDLNLNKHAVFLGENYQAQGKAAFFEGTPLPKLPVKITGGNSNEAGVEAVSDSAGNFTVDLAAKFAYSGYEGSQPQTQYISVVPRRAEEGEMSAADSLLVFPAKYVLTSREKIKDNQATVDFKVNAVDLSQIKSQYPTEDEYMGKPVGNVTLPISVIRVKYDKVETGESYNPILKTVEKKYRYDRKEEPVKEEAVTTNEQGQATFAIPIAQDEQLVATVTLTDSDNRQVKEKVYLYGQESLEANYANDQLNLFTAKELSLDPEKRSNVLYNVDEAISFVINKGEVSAPTNDQTKYLLRLSQRGLRTILASNKPEFKYTFSAKDAPNLVAVAVQFDGKRFHDASSKVLNFDTQTKKLTVNVTPNQDKYVPGDKVTLNVAVSDQDGKPQKTTVNLNVLDKALLALRGTNDDVLSSLYTKVPSGVFFTYISHQDPRSPMAEGGGGCFLAGTPILMADGSTKAIEYVVVGDEVLTKKDLHTHDLTKAKVTHTVNHQVSEYLIINYWLKVTPEHVVWANGSWQVAGNLKLGDQLLNAGGKLVTISSLIRQFENVSVYNLTTTPQHTFFAGGIYVHNEKGDRSEFKDVALFQNITTDAQGKAKVEFKLPDNLTAWRVLAEGVAGDTPPLAGSAVKEITVSQSAYVVVNLAEEYLAGDKPVLQLKAFGDDLIEDQPVEFFVEGKSIGLDTRKTITGKAFTPAKFELPSLPAGTHDLVVGMKAGGFEDKLTRKIVVKTSRLVRPANLVLSIQANQNLSWPAVKDGMVKITFSNPLLNQVRSTAQGLEFGWNDRLDSRLARNVAQEWLAKDSGQDLPADQTTLDLVQYQAKGGMNLLPRSDSDLYYSMLTAVVAPNKVDKSELTAYFNKILADQKQGRQDQIMALSGLAGLQQPTLLSLKQLVEVKDLTVEERIYAAVGAISIGDQGLAGQLLQPIIDQAQTADEKLLVTGAPNPDQQQRLTWLTAAVASGIKHPQAMKLIAGAKSLYTRENLVDLEASYFIKQASAANLTKESSINVTVGNEPIAQTLNAKNSKLVVLVAADKLAEVKIDQVQGDVSALLAAEIPILADSGTDADFKVQRQYLVNGNNTNTAQEGELVEVSLPYTIATAKQINGCVQITDWLPAGLRPISRPRLYGMPAEMVSYPYEVNNQKVSFCVNADKDKSDNSIKYYARIVNIGAFKTDPALIQPMELPGNYGLSQPGNLTINASE
jgi:uncharacterized protein YfaS (alpha-2-macroglobulin family)